MNRIPFAFSTTATLLLALIAWRVAGVGHLWAVLIGAAAGVILYNASFGFTAGWRDMVLYQRGRGLRAQMLLIGLIVVVAYPLLASGQVFGHPVRGYILPMGVASAFGAFIFGAGMQLGSGCASGTLFTVGGGSSRMVLVLVFFIAGSVLATAHWDFWAALPRMRAGISLVNMLGWQAAIAIMLAGIAVIWWISVIVERRTHGTLQVDAGPSIWPIWVGAVGLAAVALAFLLALGRPWGITYGFAVWGAQAAEQLGFEPTHWTYWSGWRRANVEGGILSTTTNASNLAIILGAMCAAAFAGRWAPVWSLSHRDAITAIIGGLLMGYGARLAYGCNIGAYLGGLTSGSLHGIWWLIWGFGGSYLGAKLRVRVGMEPRAAAT